MNSTDIIIINPKAGFSNQKKNNTANIGPLCQPVYKKLVKIGFSKHTDNQLLEMVSQKRQSVKLEGREMKSLYDKKGLQTDESQKFAIEIEKVIQPVLKRYLEKEFSMRDLSHEAQSVVRDCELDHVMTIHMENAKKVKEKEMDEYEFGTGLYNETIEIDSVHHLAPSHSKTLCGLPIRPEDEDYIMEDQFVEAVTCGVCKAKWMERHEEDSKEW